MRARLASVLTLLVVGVSCAVGWLRLSPLEPAAAAVVHGAGFDGTVAGWHSWYGSYVLGDLGPVWCVDHGLRAPDAALDYRPVVLTDHAADTRQAMAWAAARHGGDDPVDAAALMLALHDLAGAVYPAGRLDVDLLDPASMSGFEGRAGDVVARARAFKTEAVAHAHLVPPYALTADVPQVAAGAAGEAVVRLTDAAGSPVGDIAIHAAVSGAILTGAVDAVTDDDGVARWPFRALAGANVFDFTATAPDLAVHAYGARLAPAQRVVKPTPLTVAHHAAFDAPLRTLSIHKTGDDTAYLPVAGARFTVDGVGDVTVGADGAAAVAVPEGRYHVTESEPPPGYAAAGPWDVDVSGGDPTLTVADSAIPGRLVIDKIDAATGAPLDGASFAVRFDRDGDGRYETDVDPAGQLLPGRYQVSETVPPAGYAAAPDPVVVEIRSGETAHARVADAPLPPPPTTTTTPAPPPPTTTTTVPVTTTTEPATTTTTAAPEGPAVVPAALDRTAGADVEAGQLPRTGSDLVAPLGVAGLALVGSGLLLSGLALDPTALDSTDGATACVTRSGRRRPRRRVPSWSRRGRRRRRCRGGG